MRVITKPFMGNDLEEITRDIEGWFNVAGEGATDFDISLSQAAEFFGDEATGSTCYGAIAMIKFEESVMYGTSRVIVDEGFLKQTYMSPN